MDIPLKKRPWFIRYRYYLLAALALIALLGYAATLALGPRKFRVDKENVQIAEVRHTDFLEYVDVEGIVHPIMTVQVNSLEGGNVARIIGEEGDMVQVGDTLLVLENPQVERNIADKLSELEKQRIEHRRQLLEIARNRLTLQQQSLQAEYELKRLEKSYALNREEYNMGIKSKAELEVAADEYAYKTRTTRLQQQNLRHDSVMGTIQRELLQRDMAREEEAFRRETRRMEDLIVRAPVTGQLSLADIVPGQQISAGQRVGDVKVLDRFKIHAALSEYYVDRITAGLPASLQYQERRYPLKVAKVWPEVKDRSFEVDLVFTDSVPDNVRLGKSYRLQIELGQPEKTLVLPRGNFYAVTGGRWIFKLNADGTRAYRTDISIGRQNPRQYELLEGLQAGDRVLVTGYQSFGDVEEIVLE